MAMYMMLLVFTTQLALATEATPPSWVQVLPQASGRIYGVGLAMVSSSEAKAIEIAGQAARFEVLARLRSTVQGNTTIQTSMATQRGTGIQTNASQSQRVSVNGKVSVEANALPGMVIEERYVDKTGRTAYVLAYLDVVAAEKALREQLTALTSEWDRCSAEENQPAFKTYQHFRRLQGQALSLEGTASLLGAQGNDRTLREEAQRIRLHISGRLSTLQRQLTIGLRPGSSIPNDLKNLLREGVTQAGLIWRDTDPAMVLEMDFKGSRQAVNINKRSWFEMERNSDFMGVRLTVNCSICDVDGSTIGSFDIDAKGVGVDEFSARRALVKELRKTLPNRVKETISEALQP